MNAIKTILVHADAGLHCAARLRVARQLARRLEADVHALYAVTPACAEIGLELSSDSASITLAQEIDERRLALVRQVRQHAESEDGPPITWHEASGLPVDAFVQQARYADLMLLGQHDPDRPASGVPGDFVESVVMASGRPALVLPYIDTGTTLGDTVLIAWKETPEAARAVSAALPVLQQATRVHVAVWGSSNAPQTAPALDILGFLQAHGVQAELHRHALTGADVGDLMQSLAADLSADLLVMGCYGHSRARELVLGGASRTVLRSMTLPVLMAH
ncbi:universal stress protein [Aquabacterium sp. A7-Y]|uniref:universal stress protein n=1 Tax=Aquabacterium sp. A7-Y TaxID=1349605 RepID=UPI00223DFCC2|nr:universal stress protein [Aquabacterium sp. A7-Y]MCW7541198.1 universal stress protein [Aquabacterium sp. A7-Y]